MALNIILLTIYAYGKHYGLLKYHELPINGFLLTNSVHIWSTHHGLYFFYLHQGFNLMHSTHTPMSPISYIATVQLRDACCILITVR